MNSPVALTDLPSMHKLLKKSHNNSTRMPPMRVKQLALALPFAITVGCAGPNNAVIDYTVSNSEYRTLTSPTDANEPTIAAARSAAAVQTELAAAEAATKAAIAAATKLAAAEAEAAKAKQAAAAKVAAAEAEAAKAKQAAAAELAAAEAEKAKFLKAEQTVSTLDAKVAELEENQLRALAAVSAEPILAAALDNDRLGFSPSVYTTAGIGIGRADPDLSAAAGFDIDDEVDPAGQVAIGVDIAKFLSVEAHTADLGSTDLTPEGGINTQVHGVSALIYAGSNRNRFRRRGLNGYARVGFNRVESSPEGNVPFEEESSNHISLGLGAEYTTRIGLGFRADVVAYDGDVQYGQFGMLYRLGSKPNIIPKLAAAQREPSVQSPAKSKPVSTFEPSFQAALPAISDTPQATESASALSPSAAAAKARFLAQRNNRSNSVNDACTSLNGILHGVNFTRGSALLTFDARSTLSDVAKTLRTCSTRQIIVSAHTDNNGLAADNNTLSKSRARTVAIHLANGGVNKNRIRAVSYGESSPVASNSTEAGRQRNRRVELEVR